MQNRKRLWKTKVLAVFLLAALSSLSARELSLNEAISLAMENSSSLKTAELNLQSSINEAGVNSLLPSIDVSLSAQESTGNLLEGDSFQPLSVNFSPSISWSFSSSYWNSSASKNLELESAYLTYASTVNSLRSSVESSYWTLAQAYQSVINAEESLKTAEANLTKTETLYESSKASSLSLLQAKLNVSDAELSLDAARETYQKKKASFLQTLGLSEEEDLVLEAVPDVSSLDFSKLGDVVEANMDNTTTIRSAELKVRSKNQSAKTTKDNATIPTLSISTNLGYSVNQEWKDSLKFTATAKVSIPINGYIPNTSTNVNVKNAALSVEKEEISAASTRKTLEDKLSSSISSIQTSLRKQENLSLHLALAEENLSLVTVSYEAGYSSQSALTDAQKSLDSAKTSISNNNSSILSDLLTISGLLELDLNTLMEALK